MDHKSLQHAIALADEGSFVKAADKVALTQSAVSRSILNLENELGVTLFERSPNGVHPTPAGHLFVDRARLIVAELLALRQDVERARGDISGQVAFGMVPSLSLACLPDLLSHCVRQWPRLRVSARVQGMALLRPCLLRGEIEFAVTVQDHTAPDPELSALVLGPIGGWGLFCRPGHPLVARAPLTVDMLHDFPLAIASTDKALERMQRDVLHRERSRQPTAQLVCDNLFVLQRVVTQSDAMLMSSRAAMKDALGAGALVELPVPRPDHNAADTGEIVVVTPKGRSLSPAATHLIAHLKSLLFDTPPGHAAHSSSA